MRILSLYLQKYGPFTDQTIELGEADGPGLVVLYGPNEAGKSSALRAIRDLLYGFPARTRDDFLHRKADLRVGGRLLFSGGEELSVLRRKGNKNTLRSLDDREAIHEANATGAKLFDALIESVPETHFKNFYGLDHRQLVEGSETLLADDGELGRALFGAGVGSAHFRQVLEGLESEAAALFAPRASKLVINQAIKDWEALSKEIKAKSLRPADWEEQERALGESAARLERLDTELAEERRELARLSRIQSVLPALGRRRQSLEKLAELSESAPGNGDSAFQGLRPDFEERLHSARSARSGARLLAERARRTLEKEGERSEALNIASPGQGLLLERAEGIDQLHADLGGYRDARDDLPRRIQELKALDESINAMLVAMGTEATPLQVEAFRKGQSAASRIRNLASDADQRKGEVGKIARDLEKTQSDLDRLLARRAEAGDALDIGPLERTFARLVKLGDLDERIEKQQETTEALQAECRREQSRLGLERIELNDLDTLQAPSMETIEVFQARGEAHAARNSRSQEKLSEAEREREEVVERLDRRRNAGFVPSEAALETERSARDENWRALQAAWADKSGTSGDSDAVGSRGAAELGRQFEDHLREADRLADRLRFDADRVAQQSADQARLEALERAIETEEETRIEIDAERGALVSDWGSLWQSIGVDPPRSEAASRWRQEFDRLIERLGQVRELRTGLERDRSLCSDALKALEAELALLGDSSFSGQRIAGDGGRFDAMLARAEDRLTTLRSSGDELRQLDVEIENAKASHLELERERERLQADEKKWRADWEGAVSGLALPDNPPTHVATERLAEIDRLLDALRSREDTASRVDKIGLRIDRFESAVKASLHSGVPSGDQPDDQPDDPEALVLRVHADLQVSRRSEAVREKIEETLSDAREELEQAAVELEAAEAALVSLQAEAGVAEEEELDGTLETWKEIESLTQKRVEAEEEITTHSPGRSFNELEAESRAVDLDALAADVERLRVLVNEKTIQRADLNAELRGAREAQEGAFGGEAVAALSEEAEAKLASIRRESTRYLELRLARRLLEREIEAYRQANQGPVLKRALGYFRGLTRGAYPELRSDVDESDAARLVAVKRGSDGQDVSVPIEGLSNGTRDQLFLALRLASLEESMGRAEAMPLIADDILVEFDEDRSLAGLEALAQLGEKTQILLFTHHAYLADQAREMGSSAVVRELVNER